MILALLLALAQSPTALDTLRVSAPTSTPHGKGR